MVTQNHFVASAMVLEKFRSRGFPEVVTLTADHYTMPQIARSVGRYPAAPTTATAAAATRPPRGRASTSTSSASRPETSGINT